MPEKFTYEFVKHEFENKNCTLISTEYTRIDKKLQFICACGNESEISFQTFRYSGACKECVRKNKVERYGVEFSNQRPEKLTLF